MPHSWQSTEQFDLSEYGAQGCVAQRLVGNWVGPECCDDLGWVFLLAPQPLNQTFCLGTQGRGLAPGLVAGQRRRIPEAKCAVPGAGSQCRAVGAEGQRIDIAFMSW